MAGFCIGCGMCCDGTLHASVGVEQTDDLGPLLAAGATFIEVAEGRVLKQPCGAYRDGCCSIYEERPTTCRAYRCELLQSYGRGEVTYDDAEVRIRETIAVRDRVLAAAGGMSGGVGVEPLAAVVSSAFDVIKARPDREAAMAEHAGLIQDAATLMNLLNRHFKPRRRRIRHGVRTVLESFEQSRTGVFHRRVSRTADRQAGSQLVARATRGHSP